MGIDSIRDPVIIRLWAQKPMRRNENPNRGEPTMAAVKRLTRTETQGTKLQAMAAELAWIRAAGFTDARRVERLLTQFAAMAHVSPADPVELLGAIRSASLVTQEEVRIKEMLQMATTGRRRAV
jgi:hypothetical protein